jgi:peptidyl-prolyl cis-trans isomerase C
MAFRELILACRIFRLVILQVAHIVKPLDDVIISLKNGSTSNPVQSALGWHILKVEDRRVFKIAPYEAVKANLMKVIMDAKRKVLIEGLAKKATIQ